MVPFLGVSFEEALSEGQIQIDLNNSGFVFAYGEQFYPVNLHGYIAILQTSYEPNEAIAGLILQIKELQQTNDDKAYSLGFMELKEQLTYLSKSSAEKKILQHCIER